MKSILNSRFYLYFCLLLMFSACQTDNLIDDSRQSIIIRLSCDNLIQTRSDVNFFSDDIEVKYLLSDSEGNIINDFSSSFNSMQNTIVIEPLARGNYRLFVLAYSNSLNKRGLTFNNDQIGRAHV